MDIKWLKIPGGRMLFVDGKARGSVEHFEHGAVYDDQWTVSVFNGAVYGKGYYHRHYRTESEAVKKLLGFVKAPGTYIADWDSIQYIGA